MILGMIARLVPAAVFKTDGIYTINPVSSILTRSRDKEFPACWQAGFPRIKFPTFTKVFTERGYILNNRMCQL